MPTTLIEPAELASCLERPDWAGPYWAGPYWAVVDCRFELTRPEWGAAAYAESHIPGAAYAHLDRDLSGPVEAHSGRHPLPSLEKLGETLGRLGIDRRTQVVAYDQGSGAYAARLWWLLRWAGHREVAVLDGGFAAWQRAALAISSDPTTRPASQFKTDAPERTAARQPADAQPCVRGGAWTGALWVDPPALVTTAELARMVADGAPPVIVDARGADRFAGQNETLDPVAGHVPGARNHPFAGNLDAQGRFLAPAELRRRWLQTLGATPPQSVVSMCGSGVTACHNLLAMEVAGLGGGRLYAGSWSEWIRDPARPVARGPH